VIGPFAATSTARTAAIAPGSKLVVYTDGLIEARDGAGGFYGEDRLGELIRASTCDEATQFVKHILEDRDLFTSARVDDTTVVVIHRDGPPA
jgi:sigma-B regulation protein RsbU (phosphoserine phosphatase)